MKSKRLVLVFMFLSIFNLPHLSAQESTNDNPLPMPTGPYQVGATFRQWIDDSREELFTENSDDHRVLSAWIYYPAEVAEDAERMSYVMDDAIIPAIRFFIDDFFGRDFDTTFPVISQWESYVYQDAAVSDIVQSYPVILFTSPAGLPLEYSLQAVELSSHGYIVIDVLHSYGYSTELIGGGSVLKIGDFKTSFAGLMELSVNDNLMILDQLDTINAVNSEDALAGKLDLSRIGIRGHSIGGTVAQETANRDSRITAGLSIDGAFEAVFPATSLSQPFMYITVDYSPKRYYLPSEASAYLISFNGFRHNTFNDWIFWPYLQDHVNIQSTSGSNARAHEVYNAYIVAFFNEYLKNEEQLLLDGTSDEFPEVSIESLNTD